MTKNHIAARIVFIICLMSFFAATPLWAGMLWSSTVQVNDDGDRLSFHDLYSSAQRVIASRGSDVYLVWSDNRWGDRDVFFSMSHDGGDAWSPNIAVNDNTGDGTVQETPTIAVDAAGVIYLFWADDRGETSRIYFSKSLDGGNSFPPGTVIDTPLGNSAGQYVPSTAVDGLGTIYAAWVDVRDTPPDLLNRKFNGKIYFSKSTDGGLTWSDSRPIDDSVPPEIAQQNPSIITNDNGVYIAWMDMRRGNPDIYFAKSLDGGITWQESILVTNLFGTDAWEMHASLDIDSAGNLYIAYTLGSVYDIYVARSFDGGETWSSRRVDNTSGRYVANLNPSLAVTPEGVIAVAWADSRRSNWIFPPAYVMPSWLGYRDDYAIFIGISFDRGETFENYKVSEFDRGNYEFFPTVVLNDDLDVFNAWQGLKQGRNNIYFKRGNRVQ